MKKSSGKKRVSSLTFLIATTAVLAAVAVLCLFGSNLLYAMRVRNVNEQRAEVEKRNTERYEAYRQEVQELQDRLTANNNISADWPTPDTQEGISIVDLTNYPLDNPGTVTVSRQDVMLGGLLLGIIEILGKAYVSMELGDALVFAVLIIVLLVKPTGLLGKPMREKV